MLKLGTSLTGETLACVTISGVLSLDTAGPLELSADVDGSDSKFLLIGSLTWLVHREVPLKEALPDDPLPDDAPPLDDLPGDDEVVGEGEEQEEIEQNSPPNALGNAEEACFGKSFCFGKGKKF